MDSIAIAVAVLCLTLLFAIHRKITKPAHYPLPPGPTPHWLFGNAIPAVYAYRKFEEWTQEYGPIFALRQGWNAHIIIIGRMQAAIDILEKDGAATMDRPRSISAGETLSGGLRVLLTPAGERFKKLRRALHAHLQPKIVTSYGPTLMRTARQHILDIVENPSRHQDHAKRYAAAVVMALAYGTIPDSYEDPDVQAVNRCLTRLGLTMRPGIWRVDAWPFLRYIPGYLKELKDGHAEELGLFKRKMQQVRDKLARQEPTPQSFGKYLIERQRELDLNDSETAYLAGSMFGAGSDTTASAISVGVMAAAAYPDTQKKVQQELDAVVGRDRAPTLADRPAMPQMEAFVCEIFRWRPVTAGGFPHKATRDIVWGNYLIPKGSTLIGNVWSVCRDPAYFPDPETFDPQRWINEEGHIREDLKSYAFGFGRRVCPGQHIAIASVWINTALIQWAFTLREDPKRRIDTLDFTESANAHPRPFVTEFEPRVQGGWEGVKELLEDYAA